MKEFYTFIKVCLIFTLNYRIMKKLALLINAIFACAFLQAQEPEFPKNASGEIELSEVVTTDLTKDKMFSNFKRWVGAEFGQVYEAIQFEDEESGSITATLRIKAGQTSLNKKDVTTDMTFTIVVDCKDNKYRYIIKDVLIHGRVFGGGGLAPRFYNDTPYRHFKHVEQYEQKRGLLQAKSNPTAEELKDIAFYDSEIEREKTLFNSEYNALMNCISSLKKGMVFNSDF